MEYTQTEVMEKLDVSRGFIIKHSKLLGLGKKGNKYNSTLYTNQEVEILKTKIRPYNILPTIISNDGNEAIINIRGTNVIIDSEDLDKVINIAWYDNGTSYFSATIDRKTKQYLHRYLMKNPIKKSIDHIDGNKLNNKKINLRICEPAENSWNMKITKRNTSGYKGVCWVKKSKKWKAAFMKNGKNIFVGEFRTAEEAHAAYCEAAKRLHGEFARFA